MGLAERRATKEFETKQLPLLKKDIDAAAGFEVPVDVKWETLALEDESHLYAECWPKVYFQPLVEALKAITVDDMGKEALKEGLKRIEIQNTKDMATAEYVATFNAGTLLLDHRPHANVDDGKARAKAIQKLLEKNL